MRKLSPFLLTAFLLACSGPSSGPTPEQLAGQAAKVYYDYLLKGDYDAFVDGRYQPDSIPQSYRRQLVDNAKMFVGQQEKEHGGIKSVAVADARADTAHHVANAFLTFTYGDSTREDVVVPMVESKGVWYLK